MQKGNIWVVDDDSSIRWYLSEPLHEKALHVKPSNTLMTSSVHSIVNFPMYYYQIFVCLILMVYLY